MPNPAGMSDPIAIKLMLVWENSVEMDAVSSIDSSVDINGVIGPLLLTLC